MAATPYTPYKLMKSRNYDSNCVTPKGLMPWNHPTQVIGLNISNDTGDDDKQ